jgi:hypothetical protein
VVALMILAIGVVAGVLSNITGYIITGLVFHRYQAQTPNTWRIAESWTHYLYSAGIRIFACTAIALLYNASGATITHLATGAIPNGTIFGVVLWAAAAAPLIIEAALFVNWHRGFVMGLLLDWLVLCVVAGVVASMAKRLV